MGGSLPFDHKPGDFRLGCQLSGEQVEPDDRRRVLVQLRGIVFGVLVVANAHELLVLIRRCEDDGGHAEDVSSGDFVWLRSRRFEFERVDTDWDGADHAVVEFLVVLRLTRRRDVDQLPF